MSEVLLEDQPAFTPPHLISDLAVVETIFRHRFIFFREIREEINRSSKIRILTASQYEFFKLVNLANSLFSLLEAFRCSKKI